MKFCFSKKEPKSQPKYAYKLLAEPDITTYELYKILSQLVFPVNRCNLHDFYTWLEEQPDNIKRHFKMVELWND